MHAINIYEHQAVLHKLNEYVMRCIDGSPRALQCARYGYLQALQQELIREATAEQAVCSVATTQNTRGDTASTPWGVGGNVSSTPWGIRGSGAPPGAPPWSVVSPGSSPDTASPLYGSSPVTAPSLGWETWRTSHNSASQVIGDLRIEDVYCSYAVLYEAGMGGHTHILQWLVSIGLQINDPRVRGFKCGAARSGDVGAIAAVYRMGAISTMDVMLQAVKYDQLAIIEFIISIRRRVPAAVVTAALEQDRIAILDYIHTHVNWICTVRNHISHTALEWLRQHGTYTLRDSFEVVRQCWRRSGSVRPHYN